MCPLLNSVQAWWITTLLSVSLSLGSTMAINISHWCLVRSLPFAGTRRFLAGLLTFLSRQPIVNCFRASGRNWFRIIIMSMKEKSRSEFSALSFMTWCWAANSSQSCLQMNGGESSNAAGNWWRQWTTTDLVLCLPPWPGTCQSWYILTVHTLTWEKQKLSERERDCLKHLDFFAYSKRMGFMQLCERGLFCVKNVGVRSPMLLHNLLLCAGGSFYLTVGWTSPKWGSCPDPCVLLPSLLV